MNLKRLTLVLLVAMPRLASAADDPDLWWGPDKALHFGVSAGLAAAGYGVAAAFTELRPWRLGVGAGISLLAGTAKELIDLAGAGTPSWKDFTWDVIGCATGLLVAWLVDVLLGPFLVPQPQP